MIIKQKGLFRIVTMEAYNGYEPITVYMVQRERESHCHVFGIFTKVSSWENVKGFKDRKKAESLFELLA